MLNPLRLLPLAAIFAAQLTGCASIIKDSHEVPEYSAQQFFDTTTLFGSSINHDASAVLATSDATGVFNVYRYPINGEEPEALTQSTDDALMAVSWFPADDRFLYTADQGGDELNHLWVRGPDQPARDLTPGEGLKALFYGWRDDDRAFFVATNERDPKAFDLYRYATNDYARELVYTNTEAWQLAGVSGDGRWLALQQIHSNADNDVYLIDLHGDPGSLMHVTPHAGNVDYVVYGFTPDNRRLLLGSNADTEFTSAWAYDLSTGEVNREYDAEWDVSFLYYSEQGRYRVVGVNADARTELEVLDTRREQLLQLPALPAGDLHGVAFSEDEQYMVFYLDSDRSPSNLYSWKIGETTATRLSSTLSAAIDPQDLVMSEVVRFESFDGLEIPGLLYRPKGASALADVPAVIYIHGGPGGQTRTGYNPVIQHLVNHGYAIFGVNNRGSSGYGTTFFHLDDRKHGEADLQDIVYAKRYLQSLEWVDRERIAVMGGSYGGFLTMAAMAFTDEFDAGINIFGVTNWVRTLESIPPWWESFRQYLYDELGDPAVDGERLRRISPLFYGEQVSQPVLVVQGANDPRVLQVESDEMVEAIRANDVPVEYVLFDDEGHGFRKKENRITAQQAYLEFLDRYLSDDADG